nr:T9SS type A sorting domain-containing protein [Bacteroidota bacterium]
ARNHMYPVPAFLSQTQEVIVFFSEQDLNQNQRGLYAQKFDLAGNRMWTDDGKMLIGLSNQDYSQLKAAGVDDKGLCVYEAYEFGNFTDAKMQAVMLNTDGGYVWPDEFIDMSTYQSSKLHPVLSEYYFGQWVSVWEDERSTGRDIYAQNIQSDGTLGQVITGLGNSNSGANDKIVNVTPNPFIEHLNFNFGQEISGNVQILIYNMQGVMVSSDMIKIEDGISKNITLHQGNLSAGIYQYIIVTDQGRFTGKLVKQ